MVPRQVNTQLNWELAPAIRPLRVSELPVQWAGSWLELRVTGSGFSGAPPQVAGDFFLPRVTDENSIRSWFVFAFVSDRAMRAGRIGLGRNMSCDVELAEGPLVCACECEGQAEEGEGRGAWLGYFNET